MKKSLALTGAAAGALIALGLAAGVARAADATAVTWSGAPVFTDDDSKFKVRGRILLDGIYEDVDNDTGADFKARQVRGRQIYLGVEGQLNSQWAYKIEGGWANGSNPNWDDVVIEYKPNKSTSLQLGNLKVASIENITSQRFTSFLDRGPFADITDLSYTVGAVVRENGTNWSFTGGLTGGSINNTDAVAGNGHTNALERWAATARFVYMPILTDQTKVHLAVWGRYRDAGSEAFSYNARPNTNYGSQYIGSSTAYSSGYAKSDKMVGAEAMVIHGPFSVQGEYAHVWADGLHYTGVNRPDAGIDTAYAFISFFPTGESRNYNPVTGEIGRQKVNHPTTDHGFGAVELLARYDYADLSDIPGSISTTAATAPTGSLVGTALAGGGKYNGVTIGANYYPFSYVKFMANYTHGWVSDRNFSSTYVSNNDGGVLTPGATSIASNDRNAEIDIFQVRAQLDF